MSCFLADATPLLPALVTSETPLASKCPLGSDEKGKKVAGLDSADSGPQAVTLGTLSHSLSRPKSGGSPKFFLPSASGSKGSGLDSRPLHLPSTLGAIRSTTAKLLPSRRSLRLAAKHRGTKKSTLLRAQEIMCKKLKMVRFAARSARSHPTSSASSSTAVANEANSGGPENGQPLQLSTANLPQPAPTSNLPQPAPPPTTLKDPAFPLTDTEIQQILESCGVMPKKGGTSDVGIAAAAGLATDVGAVQAPAVSGVGAVQLPAVGQPGH